jgi:MFS family permease
VLFGFVPMLTGTTPLSIRSLALGAAAGFVAPLPTAVVADCALPLAQGLAIGWLRTVTDGGQIAGPLVMGVWADALGLSAPFQLGALLLVGAAWWCWHFAARPGCRQESPMPDDRDRVMVVTAHPDDPEFGAGGTIAKFVEEGREVTYVIVTNGNKGSSDRTITPARLARVRERGAAARSPGFWRRARPLPEL